MDCETVSSPGAHHEPSEHLRVYVCILYHVYVVVYVYT